MTDTLLALVPTYGIWLILLSLILSCLALPVPSSILVMAAGAFAAAGDLLLWQVQLAAFTGFIVGDQIAYFAARYGGSPFIGLLKSKRKLAEPVAKAERLLARYGALSVFLSRTVLSPLGAYIGYLSGALRLRWSRFTAAAIAGAICWCAGYSLLGYFFAARIAQLAEIIGNVIGFTLAGAFAASLGWYLWSRWKAYSTAQDGKAISIDEAPSTSQGI